MILRNLVLVAAVTLASAMSHAEEGGNSGGGGGDAIQTSKGWTMLDLAESMQTRFFAPIGAKGTPKIDELDAYQKKAAVEKYYNDAVRNLLYCDGHSAGNQQISIGMAAGYLQFRDVPGRAVTPYGREILDSALGKQMVWIETDLPLSNVDDEGVIRLLDLQTKTQVAIQKDNIVMVYAPIYKKMDAKNQAALVIHELVLRIVLRLNPNHYSQHGTSYIRQVVQAVMSPEFENLSKAAQDQICGPDSGLVNNTKN